MFLHKEQLMQSKTMQTYKKVHEKQTKSLHLSTDCKQSRAVVLYGPHIAYVK